MNFEEVIVRKDGSESVLASGSFDSGAIITVGSSKTASISIDGIETEQLVIVLENGVPFMINRSDGLTLDGKTLRNGERAPLGETSLIRFGEYIVSFRNESQPIDLVSGHFFYVVGGPHPFKSYPTADSMWFGTNGRSFSLAPDKRSFEQVLCRIGFDWSGATVFPRSSGRTLLNGDVLYDPRPLRRGDVLSFQNSLNADNYYCCFDDVNIDRIPDRKQVNREVADVTPTEEARPHTAQSISEGFAYSEIILIFTGLVLAVIVAALLFYLV